MVGQSVCTQRKSTSFNEWIIDRTAGHSVPYSIRPRIEGMLLKIGYPGYTCGSLTRSRYITIQEIMHLRIKTEGGIFPHKTKFHSFFSDVQSNTSTLTCYTGFCAKSLFSEIQATWWELEYQEIIHLRIKMGGRGGVKVGLFAKI